MSERVDRPTTLREAIAESVSNAIEGWNSDDDSLPEERTFDEVFDEVIGDAAARAAEAFLASVGVSEQAVEAAARAMYEWDGAHSMHWHRIVARVALEAVAALGPVSTPEVER